jgi:peroxiredoxin
MKSILTILTLCTALAQAGNSNRAKQLTQAYDVAYTQWINDVRSAADNASQNAAWLRKPNAGEAGRAVWEEIRGDLSETWILDPAAWLLTEASEFAIKGGASRSPAVMIRKAVWEHHLRSPKVGPYCISLTQIQDPKAMKLLETVEKVNENPAVKGASALAQAILLRRAGDGKIGMRSRQEKIRIAIKAPDLTVGKTTTQALLKDEIFRMTRLNINTKAPNFRGIEVTQKISSLKDYEGRVTILFFWHSLMPAYEETLALFRKYQAEFANQNIVLLGINMDNPLTLRKLIAEGKVTWTNFSDSTQTITKLYRTEVWPHVYVLDEEHKIRFAGDPGAFVKITAEDLAKQAAARKAAALAKPNGQ